MEKPTQKYEVNERVGIQGWASYCEGVVEDIQWVFHPRRGEHTWGYKINFDEGQHNPFTMIHIPEGYLRKL